MGNCGSCSVIKRNHRVGKDEDDDANSKSDSETEYYTERVTHIVADIHERILHKVQHSTFKHLLKSLPRKRGT